MSETKGQCRRQLTESYADNLACVPRYDWILADAIDRIAADVAEIKANVDGVASEDNGKFVPSELEWSAFNELVDCKNAAIREREEAIRERENANRERDEARADVKKLSAVRTVAIYERDVAIRERDKARKERDEAGAKFRRLLGELAEARAEVERLREACVLTNVLDRAGSPPVVEVPVMRPSAYGYDSPFHGANYREAHSRACAAHRAALDKAGIQWKEVPSE